MQVKPQGKAADGYDEEQEESGVMYCPVRVANTGRSATHGDHEYESPLAMFRAYRLDDIASRGTSRTVIN